MEAGERANEFILMSGKADFGRWRHLNQTELEFCYMKGESHEKHKRAHECGEL